MLEQPGLVEGSRGVELYNIYGIFQPKPFHDCMTWCGGTGHPSPSLSQPPSLLLCRTAQLTGLREELEQLSITVLI